MNREDKRGIFFGVVGVLTLIVAIIGASLAYFSITTRSDSDVVTVQSATVQIAYESGTKLAVDNIIPSSQEVAVETFDRYLEDPATYQKCVDDKGRNVCGVYNFKLTNDGDAETVITMKVEPTEFTNEDGSTPRKFKNLSYILYDVTGFTDNGKGDYVGTITEDRIIAQDTFESTYTTDDSGNVKEVTGYNTTTIVDYDELDDENNLKLPGNTTKIYRLFVWLDEVGPQDYEQGAAFQGGITIEVAGQNTTITGNADSTLNG